MIEYTAERLKGLTGDELLRQYRMQEGVAPTQRHRYRLALAELESHDAAMTALRNEIERRMVTIGIFATHDGLGTAFFRTEHGLICRSLWDVSKLDPPAEFAPIEMGGAA